MDRDDEEDDVLQAEMRKADEELPDDIESWVMT